MGLRIRNDYSYFLMSPKSILYMLGLSLSINNHSERNKEGWGAYLSPKALRIFLPVIFILTNFHLILQLELYFFSFRLIAGSRAHTPVGGGGVSEAKKYCNIATCILSKKKHAFYHAQYFLTNWILGKVEDRWRKRIPWNVNLNKNRTLKF